MSELNTAVGRDGKTYRIRKCGMTWEIEYRKDYKYPSGETFTAWFAAFEPKQRLFTSLNEVKEVYNQLLEGIYTL